MGAKRRSGRADEQSDTYDPATGAAAIIEKETWSGQCPTSQSASPESFREGRPRKRRRAPPGRPGDESPHCPLTTEKRSRGANGSPASCRCYGSDVSQAVRWISMPRLASSAMYSAAGMHWSGVQTPVRFALPMTWSCPVMESEKPVVRSIALILFSVS